MIGDPLRCARCGEELPAGATVCPACATPVPVLAPGDPPLPGAVRATSPARAPAAPTHPGAAEMMRRIARLQQWSEAAHTLGVSLPSVPDWTEEFVRAGSDLDRWSEVVQGVERLAQKRVVQALEDWEKLIKNRLARLEAYAVDSRLERDQIEDILHGARSGDVGQSLATCQQVDRVVALKERHLDQARDDLERLVSLLRDMQALGLPTTQDPSEISDDLERELRAGRLASLKQQLRALRTQALGHLRVGLPSYVSQYGEYLTRERADGVPIELEAAELARGAREFARGHPEEALRRLRVLAQVHGSGSGRSAATRPRPASPYGGDRPTEPSRTG